MLEPGQTIPDAAVWRRPREPLSLHELADEGRFLVFFYLFDWSAT